MKHIFFLFALVGIFSCKESNNQNNKAFTETTENFKKTIKRDTLISLANNVKLYFHHFDKGQKLWKLPKLIKNNKDTINIDNWDNDWGSELDIKLSPNKRYIILDAIIKGFLDDNEKELYENYTCRLIDIVKFEVQDSFQENCDGEWNENNEWVFHGEVIFSEKSNSNNSLYNVFIANDCENSRFSISIDNKQNFRILDHKKIIAKGIAKIDNSKTPALITLGKIDGAYYGDSIVIQNHDISTNEYNHFTQCDSKYLTFTNEN